MTRALAIAHAVPHRPLIGGEWAAGGGGTFEVLDPATEQPICHVVEAGEDDVDRAVGVRPARHSTTAMGQAERRGARLLLHRVADLLAEHAEDFAAVESLDIGKPGFEPRFIDLPQAIDTFRHFAGWADKIEGRTIPTPGYMGRPTFNYTVREPVGVVAAITPWNSPTMIGSWKIAPALAAGCPVVLKPPEDARLTSLMLADLIQKAGFPRARSASCPAAARSRVRP